MKTKVKRTATELEIETEQEGYCPKCEKNSGVSYVSESVHGSEYFEDKTCSFCNIEWQSRYTTTLTDVDGATDEETLSINKKGKCTKCKTGDIERRKYDDGYGHGDHTEIHTCSSCGNIHVVSFDLDFCELTIEEWHEPLKAEVMKALQKKEIQNV